MLGRELHITEALDIFGIQLLPPPLPVFNHTQNAVLVNCADVSTVLYLLHLTL